MQIRVLLYWWLAITQTRRDGYVFVRLISSLEIKAHTHIDKCEMIHFRCIDRLVIGMSLIVRRTKTGPSLIKHAGRRQNRLFQENALSGFSVHALTCFTDAALWKTQTNPQYSDEYKDQVKGELCNKIKWWRRDRRHVLNASKCIHSASLLHSTCHLKLANFNFNIFCTV